MGKSDPERPVANSARYFEGPPEADVRCVRAALLCDTMWTRRFPAREHVASLSSSRRLVGELAIQNADYPPNFDREISA
jgi:hypothetical protein